MDRKEVGRARTARTPSRRAGAGKATPAAARRLAALYGFAGAVFCLGFAALMLVIRNELQTAGRIVLAGTVFASMEYYVRQRFAGPSAHADELSTLGDLLCFSVVPAFLLYRLTLQHWGVLGVGAVFVIVFAAVLRLSLFKIYNPVDEKRDFIGIPLTMTAAFIALLTQLLAPGDYFPFFRLGLMAVVMILAFLTVSVIRYPNPSASLGFTLAMALAAGAVCAGPPLAAPAAWLLLGGGALFIVFAPGFAKGRRSQHAGHRQDF